MGVNVDLSAILAGRVVSVFLSAGAMRAKVAVLGEPQQRALERAVRGAAEVAGAGFPELGAISVDIDLLSDDAVVADVLHAAADARVPDLAAASERWSELYETEPPRELIGFLQGLAVELGKRIRGDPALQTLFLVRAADTLIDQTETIVGEISALREGVQAQTDPVRAVRYRGEDIGADLGLLSDIVGTVGEAMARGPLGASLERLDVSLTGEGASFRLNPKPGADIRVKLTTTAPDTPEGRERIAALRRAVESGDAVEFPDVEITMSADGVPIAFPSPINASASLAAVRHRAVLEFRARGLSPERFLIDLDVKVVDGHLQGETAQDTTSWLGVWFKDAPAGSRNFGFRPVAEALSVRQQVKIARLGRHLKRGGRLTLWFAEMDAEMHASFGPNADYQSADKDARILGLFEEVQRRLGAEVAQVEELTPLDVAYLAMAKRLLDRGRAIWPGRGGTFRVTSGGDIRANVKRGKKRVTLTSVSPEAVLPLSRHPLPLGQAATKFSVVWPPKNVSTSEEGHYETVMDIDENRPIYIERDAGAQSERRQ